MTWRNEFPADYAVPPEIEALVTRAQGSGLVTDTSWHNNACPSFGIVDAGGDGVELWVEHPDPKMRECSNTRYFVVDIREGFMEETAFNTDDVNEAIQELQRRAAARAASQEVR